MKRWIAMAVALVMVLSLCACGIVPQETTNTQGNLEKPPVTTTEGSQEPTEPEPGQTEPQETEPTQPAVCSHEYVNGTCKYCGALKPSEFLTYELNEDGKSYRVTGINKDFYKDFTIIIADSYNGLPVTTIGDSAFSGYYENGGHCMDFRYYLKKVVIPNTVTTIESGAFSLCGVLDTVCISSIEAWYAIDFRDSSSNPLHYGADLYLNGELVTELVIPEGVTSIGNYAFFGSNITGVTIPDSVTSIGNQAFTDCDGLTNVALPDSVTSIGESAFSGCDSLTNVTLPNSVTSIGDSAFAYCDNLTYKRYDTGLYLGNSENPYLVLADTSGTDISGCNIHKNTKIISGAFEYCDELSSITIPEGVISIGGHAFSCCDSLTSIIIPESVNTIGGSAFYRCTSLTSITIPNSVTSIGDSAFYGCGFSSLTLPNSLTSIEDYLFYGCENLTSIVIPEGVTTIGTGAFERCENLKSVTIPTTVTHIGSDAFALYIYGYVGPTQVYTTSIEAWCGIAFEDENSNPLWDGATLCLNGEAVTDVVIPDGVTSIGNYAFYGSNITSVTIPATVTSIGDNAFASCEKLASITFAGTMEQWYEVALGENWKSGVPAKRIICSDGTANL